MLSPGELPVLVPVSKSEQKWSGADTCVRVDHTHYDLGYISISEITERAAVRVQVHQGIMYFQRFPTEFSRSPCENLNRYIGKNVSVHA